MSKSKGSYDDAYEDDYEDDFEDEFEEESHKKSEGKQGDVQDDGGGWTNIDFGDIELEDQIGGGGVGIVYNGRYKGEPVALKTLFDPRVDEQLKQEYMDELLIMSKLNHPNVVDFYGACMKAPNLCMVMELCEMSLFTLLHQTTEELGPKRLTNMLIGVAQAMHYLHTRKPMVIHRDLKSHNLLVADNGQLKLCDFGLVSTKVTQAGTPAYMCAELLENKPFSKKVDLYSFGVLMWEMFERGIPFAGLLPYEIKECVCAGERPNMPADMPHEIQVICEQCWAQEPEDRPDFIDVLCDLREALDLMPDKIVSNLEMLESSMGGDCLGDALDSMMRRK